VARYVLSPLNAMSSTPSRVAATTNGRPPRARSGREHAASSRPLRIVRPGSQRSPAQASAPGRRTPCPRHPASPGARAASDPT
jgi:hypothetical protein